MNTLFNWKQLFVFSCILLVLTCYTGAQDHDHDHDHDHGEAHMHDGAPAYYLAEHGDFDIGYEDGKLELHIHLHAGTIVDGNALEADTVFSPDQLIVVLTEDAEILRPAGDIWELTGAGVDEPFWVLPQHEKEGLPAFGFATEEIPAGVFVDDLVQLNLRFIKGPGDFSLWEDDAFGQPTFLFSTHEGMNSFAFPAGLHAHYNWGFTAHGDYTLVFEATAELVAGGEVEALSIYHFKVTEEPLCLKPLAADVNGDCVVDEHDMHLIVEDFGMTAPIWPADYDHDHDHDHDHDDNIVGWLLRFDPLEDHFLNF